MYRSLFGCLLLLLGVHASRGQSVRWAEAKNIHLSWELVSNLQATHETFEARIVFKNQSTLTLTEQGWTLYFNMAPRPILPNKRPQPALIQHINGDWYKLVPSRGFRLAPGDSLTISYWGVEGVIKETDAPLGPYFVFTQADGQEQIVPAKAFEIKPFVREEQLRRNKDDLLPLPTAAERYRANETLKLLPPDSLPPLIPSPVRYTRVAGPPVVLDVKWSIRHEVGLEREAAFLAKKLQDLTGRAWQIRPLAGETSSSTAIVLRTRPLTVNGVQHEAYTLSVKRQGIQIAGADAAGVFYGVQSLLALIPPQVFRQPQARISLPALEIEDAPRFASRGMQLDVARNFQTKESILRLLDLLAFYKINRFLLYTTEDEGWRLEIPGLPELTQVGAQRQHTTGKEAPALHPAYGSGPTAYAEGTYGSGYYTREDFVEILRYAAERHIEVLPVVNFPGHARAAIKAMEARYARLMKEGKPEEAEEYRLIDPEDTSVYLSAQGYKDNVVSVARESSYRFYEKVVEEIARMYEAAGLRLKVLHVGGDEVPGNAWTQSPMAQRLLREEPSIGTFPNLHAYFLKKLLKRLERFKLEFHGWEEIALLHPEKGRTEINTELARQPVVAYIWNNLFDYPDLGYRLANAGYKVVLCNVSNFYFDLAYDNDPQEPGLYWAGFVDTFDNFAFAPYAMFNTTPSNHMGKPFDWEADFPKRAQLTTESRANIIGLEAQLWSETVKGRSMMEYYTLPKLMGFAESAWAAERPWENIPEATAGTARLKADWNRFANKLALTELPRLAALNGGYTYRIPMPGAKVEQGKVWANTELPGLSIRYTTDGSEPNVASALYRGPLPLKGSLRLRAFDASGRSSRVVVIK